MKRILIITGAVALLVVSVAVIVESKLDKFDFDDKLRERLTGSKE